MTVEQARNIVKDWAAQVRQGGDPMADRQAHRDAPTMSELFDRYAQRSNAAARESEPRVPNDANGNRVPSLGTAP